MENNWLPIETAPKDGTNILISDGYFVELASWAECAQFEQMEEGPGWQVFCAEDTWYSVAYKEQDVKYWQPCPVAPFKK